MPASVRVPHECRGGGSVDYPPGNDLPAVGPPAESRIRAVARNRQQTVGARVHLWRLGSLATRLSRRLGSTPSVAVHPDGQQDVFWKAPGGQLEEMRYFGAWIKPMPIGNADTLGSAPSAVVDPRTPTSADDVFWKGVNRKGVNGWLWHLTFSNPLAVTGTSQMLNSGPLASAPTVAVHPDGHEDVFWEGTNGRLYEMQPTSIAASEQGEAGKLGSPPAAAVDPLTGQDHVFWKGSNGYLYELVGTENHWQVKVLSMLGPTRIGAGRGNPS